MDKDEYISRLEFALEEYMHFIGIRNEKDAYLYALGEWALPTRRLPFAWPSALARPKRSDYGLDYKEVE